MIQSFAILLLCQAAGAVLHAATGLPVPGPIIGIVVLLAWLCVRFRQTATAPALPAADGLLAHLSLFFVPPGVLAVMQLAGSASALPAIAAALVASSVAAFAVTGFVAQSMLNREARPDRLTADRAEECGSEIRP